MSGFTWRLSWKQDSIGRVGNKARCWLRASCRASELGGGGHDLGCVCVDAAAAAAAVVGHVQ